MILEQTWFLEQGIFPLIKNMKYNNNTDYPGWLGPRTPRFNKINGLHPTGWASSLQNTVIEKMTFIKSDITIF